MFAVSRWKVPRSPAVGHLPNLIILGAMKCGTTSLHYYLSLHPQIRMSREKELKFFMAEANWPKGLDWYRSNFTGAAEVYGEATPMYTSYPLYAGVPERMAAVVPDAKLIYLVRDPVERLLADYIHRCAIDLEHRPLPEALADLRPENCYLQRSLYAWQLQRYRKYFPDAHILIVPQEALRLRRAETLRRVFEFLRVEASFNSPHFSVLKHQTETKRRKNRVGRLLARLPGMRLIERLPPGWRYRVREALYWPFSFKIERPALDPAVEANVKTYLADDVRRLRAYTGYALETWCV